MDLKCLSADLYMALEVVVGWGWLGAGWHLMLRKLPDMGSSWMFDLLVYLSVWWNIFTAYLQLTEAEQEILKSHVVQSTGMSSNQRLRSSPTSSDDPSFFSTRLDAGHVLTVSVRSTPNPISL